MLHDMSLTIPNFFK